MSIDNHLERHKDKARLLGAMALIFSLGFASGYHYLDAEKEGSGSVVLEDKSAQCAALFEASEPPAAAAESASAGSEKEADAAGAVLSGSVQADRRFAGSKNSTLYHTPDCQYVKRIKEENRVWFGSGQEAETAGRKPHSCVSP